MESLNGKNASEAAIISSPFFSLKNLFILFIAISQLSNLLGCPDPIPIVESLFAITIALDFTNLQTLNANIKFFKVLKLGLILETILKFDFEKENVSAVCISKELNCEDISFNLISLSLLESIILRFFFFF